MALVALLRGINVGGHRSFRPSVLAAQLEQLDAVNIGAAGTLLIRRPVSRGRLRAELGRRLPFAAEVMICEGRDFLRLVDADPFAAHHPRPGVVRFVSVLDRPPRTAPSFPLTLPPRGPWLLKVLARDHRFVFGLYRRHLKVIGYLGSLDRLFGARATTRNWNTVTAIARALRPPTPQHFGG